MDRLEPRAGFKVPNVVRGLGNDTRTVKWMRKVVKKAVNPKQAPLVDSRQLSGVKPSVSGARPPVRDPPQTLSQPKEGVPSARRRAPVRSSGSSSSSTGNTEDIVSRLDNARTELERVSSLSQIVLENIGSYEVQGKGTFGEAVKVTLRNLLPVVLKFTKLNVDSFRQTQEDVNTEHATTKKLHHQYIVAVASNLLRWQQDNTWTVEDENLYTLPIMVLQWASLGSVQTVFANKHIGVCRWLQTFARQLAEAVNHVHSNGYIHLDVHAGNILIHQSDPADPSTAQVLLADFGLAINQTTVTEKTLQYNGGGGTARPPEIFTNGPLKNANYKFTDVTNKIDWWSFGAVLLQLAYGISTNVVGSAAPLKWNTNNWTAHLQQYLTTWRDIQKTTIIVPGPFSSAASKNLFEYRNELEEEFAKLVVGCLTGNKDTRWGYQQVAQSPFITGAPTATVLSSTAITKPPRSSMPDRQEAACAFSDQPDALRGYADDDNGGVALDRQVERCLRIQCVDCESGDSCTTLVHTYAGEDEDNAAAVWNTVLKTAYQYMGPRGDYESSNLEDIRIFCCDGVEVDDHVQLYDRVLVWLRQEEEACLRAGLPAPPNGFRLVPVGILWSGAVSGTRQVDTVSTKWDHHMFLAERSDLLGGFGISSAVTEALQSSAQRLAETWRTTMGRPDIYEQVRAGIDTIVTRVDTDQSAAVTLRGMLINYARVFQEPVTQGIKSLSNQSNMAL